MQKQIHLKKKDTWRKLLCLLCILSVGTLTAFGQKRVNGTVTDAKGEPVIGANVVEKGSANGSITDMDGKFTLTVKENAVLQISFVGFVTQEIVVGNQSRLDITLQEDTQALEEVVVVGYGTRVKGALTGSIAKADSKVFEKRPIVNAVNALQGTMPGVTVIRGSSRPGFDQSEIQVRGYSSIAGAKPLVLIDGIAGDLNMINPGDIDNVTVLKDAAASIYGARASDGVILVTTKKGTSGKPKLTYSGNFGVKKPHFLKEVTTTSQLIDMYNESMINMGLSPASQDVVDKIKANSQQVDPVTWYEGFGNFPAHYGYVDWTSAIVGNATRQNHDVSLSGGGDNNTYLFSARYNRDGGHFKFGDPAHSDQYNLAANNSFRNIFGRLNIDTRLQYDSRRTDEPTMTDTALAWLWRVMRFNPIYTPGGHFYLWQGNVGVANYLENGGKRQIMNDALIFNAKGDLQIIDGLKLIGQYGVRLTHNRDKAENRTIEWYDWNDVMFRQDNIPNSASYATGYNRYSSYTAYLEYNKSFAQKHNVSLMAGASHEENNAESSTLSASDFLSNDLFTFNLSNKTDIKYLSAVTDASDWALTSFFGRLGYNYDMKYLIDFTLRADGSSKFASGKRWSALFPAVQAAWNLGNETFVRNTNLFDNLKLRLSIGQSGNQELSFGNYDYISRININNSVYDFGTPGVNFPGATATIASQDRTWETITTYNTGIDFSVLNSKLSGSFDVYIKKNSNMLVAQDLPALFGGSAPTQNIGELETKGFDLTLGWRDKVKDFSYGVSFMLSDSKNKLVKLLGNDTKATGLVYAREGYSLYSYFGYVSDGIIQDEAQLAEYKKLGGNVPARIGIGDMMYRDVDGDGKITAFGDDGNSGDLVYLGNRLPRYTYSSNIDLSYKNVDLSIFLQGVGKRNVMRDGDFATPFYYFWFQPMAYFYEKTWTPERSNAEFPRMVQGSRGWDDIRDWNYLTASDASFRLMSTAYMRVKLLTLAYRLPQSFCRNVKLQNARIYLSGEDIFTFAKGTWEGSYDPEEGWQRSDEQTYPFSKTFSIGIDITF
ncbi:MAG: TonB-dependent receptor [Tannerella sp.]|jgi:TonB-linked SusC/RagA family outer membrane protein|nr:TonB-dependent receptor [Tannerella sp.]